jgi:Calcineurin-like phosphoesterase
MTEIVSIADLHEHLLAVPACDLLVIAGDVSFAGKGDLRAKHAFLTGPFKDWLSSTPRRKRLLVAGNHDQSIEAWGIPDGLSCHYLKDDGIELFGVSLWGTPWQPWFLDWALNAPRRNGEGFLASKFDLIPAETDVVVGHGPPRGYVGRPVMGDRRARDVLRPLRAVARLHQHHRRRPGAVHRAHSQLHGLRPGPPRPAPLDAGGDAGPVPRLSARELAQTSARSLALQ